MNDAELKTWLRDRLVNDPRARGDWRRLFAAAWDRLTETKLEVVLDEARIEAAIDATLAPEQLRGFLRPIVTQVLEAWIDEARTDQAPLSRFVDAENRSKLHSLLSRPSLIHPDWVRAVFRGAAAEAILNDTLYRALRDFSTLMPRLFLRLSPVGKLGILGGAGMVAGRIVEELEKIIEPEIKAFLTGGTQKMLERAADFAAQRIDDPASTEFRRDLADFVLSRSPAFHVKPLGKEVIEEALDIAEAIVRRSIDEPALREEGRRVFRAELKRFGERPVREILAELGADQRPPLEAWADAAWPTVKLFLEAPEVGDWLDGLVDELLANARA